jgi:hypothetical protein
MVHKPEFLVAMTGAMVLAGSFAAFLIGAPGVEASPSALRKADRLPMPASTGARVPVGAVEVSHAPQGLVVLRGRDGAVLYWNDPAAGTTTVSRDVDMPVVAPPAPVAQKPAPREADETPPPARNERRSRPVGCEGAVSPLVKQQAANTPSLCLAAVRPPHAA